MTDRQEPAKIWQQSGPKFQPGSTHNIKTLLPPAIYRFVQPPLSPWYFEQIASSFTFPYKIYGLHEEILTRVQRAWHGLSSNLGVVFNGLKGTGKTITAQQVVNWAISAGLPVLSVSDPVPLAEILESVEQDLLILFDEFEKTHSEDNDSQQNLLSVIDGVSRSEFRRLFLFTTNSLRINENLVDRPSRIRYTWCFGRLSSDVLEELLNDLLDKSLLHMRSRILAYLNTRSVLTIDVAKAVITEVNLFKELPDNFQAFMNLTEREPTVFRLEILSDFEEECITIEHFRLQAGFGNRLNSFLSKTGQDDFERTYLDANRVARLVGRCGKTLEIIRPTKTVNEWVCQIQIPTEKTWIGPYTNGVLEPYLWLDEKPSGWKVPSWIHKLRGGQRLPAKEAEEFGEWQSSGRIYGSENSKEVLIRISVVEETTFVIS